MTNDYKNYDPGVHPSFLEWNGHCFCPSYQQWIGKYANKKFNYFAKHTDGCPLTYNFNSLGYRGPEHHADPDISVFGSSFSFGVGIEFEQCWHQQLGNYKVNCYAPAGFLVTNNDIIDHFNQSKINSGLVILQFREFKYNVGDIDIPKNALCFVVDESLQPNILNFLYSSFVDKAEDQTHPGPLTHQQWAQEIKKTFKL